MSNGNLRYWISWNEPHDAQYGADPRPVVWPLPASIPHWWCSGAGDGYSTVCAVVDVNGDADSAKALIAKHWRPRDFRFVEQKGWSVAGWMPEGTRFPVKPKKADEVKS